MVGATHAKSKGAAAHRLRTDGKCAAGLCAGKIDYRPALAAGTAGVAKTNCAKRGRVIIQGAAVQVERLVVHIHGKETTAYLHIAAVDREIGGAIKTQAVSTRISPHGVDIAAVDDEAAAAGRLVAVGEHVVAAIQLDGGARRRDQRTAEAVRCRPEIIGRVGAARQDERAGVIDDVGEQVEAVRQRQRVGGRRICAGVGDGA